MATTSSAAVVAFAIGNVAVGDVAAVAVGAVATFILIIIVSLFTSFGFIKDHATARLISY